MSDFSCKLPVRPFTYFSFANLAQARALQVSLSRYSYTKITAAFRIFFFTSGPKENGVFHDFSL